MKISVKPFFFISAFALAVAFSACGGDNGSSADDEQIFDSSGSVSISSSERATTPKSSEAKSDDGAKSSSSKSDIAGSSSSKTEVVESSESKMESSSSSPYGEFIDDRDGKTYKTVIIGDQTWMAKNLNYATSSGSWCGGGKKEAVGDCNVYGRLYSWDAAMIACPKDWHLPSAEEWKKLFSFVGGDEIFDDDEFVGIKDAGSKLKDKSGLWNPYEGIVNEDAYGFSVLPAGFSDEGYSSGTGKEASFWTFTEDEEDDDFAFHWDFEYDSADALFYEDQKFRGFSARCIKD